MKSTEYDAALGREQRQRQGWRELGSACSSSRIAAWSDHAGCEILAS